MRTEKRFERSSRQILGIARGQRRQKLQKLLSCPRRKAIGRMTDNIGMNVLGKIESDRESTRIRILIVIRYQRNACRVRESHSHRRRLAHDMRCPRQCGGLGRRRERASQHDALGMGWTKARVQSKDRVELLQNLIAKRNKFFIGRKRHNFLLISIYWTLIQPKLEPTLRSIKLLAQEQTSRPEGKK